MIHIEVDWQCVVEEDDSAWSWKLALYAIVHPTAKQVAYIGKADGSTVRARCRRSGAKAKFWDWYERAYRTDTHLLFVGCFLTEPGVRLTRQLVADCESLLINMLKPLGNVACAKTRISRPGLRVTCEGDWPHPRRSFVDRAPTAFGHRP